MNKEKKTIKEIFHDWLSYCEESNHFDPYSDAIEFTIDEMLHSKENWDRERAEKLFNYLIFER